MLFVDNLLIRVLIECCTGMYQSCCNDDKTSAIKKKNFLIKNFIRVMFTKLKLNYIRKKNRIIIKRESQSERIIVSCEFSYQLCKRNIEESCYLVSHRRSVHFVKFVCEDIFIKTKMLIFRYVVILIVFTVVNVIDCKTFRTCELARALAKEGVPRVLISNCKVLNQNN